jgi:putative salt-induced outer membrane protein YdiY
MIANVTTISNILSTLKSPFAITLSIKNLVDPGNTRPASLLITISRSPTKRSFFRGQMMVLKTWPNVILDLGISQLKKEMKLDKLI